jgi:transposase-like protein
VLEGVLREEARYKVLLSRVEGRPPRIEETRISGREALRRAIVREALRKEPTAGSLSRLTGLLRMEGRTARRIAAHLGEGIGSPGRASGVTMDDLYRSTRAARAVFLRAARHYLRAAERVEGALLQALLSYRHQLGRLERASRERKRPTRPVPPLSAYLRDPVYRQHPFTAVAGWAAVSLRHGLSFPQVVRTLTRASTPLPYSVATELAHGALRVSQQLLRTWIRSADRGRGY